MTPHGSNRWSARSIVVLITLSAVVRFALAPAIAEPLDAGAEQEAGGNPPIAADSNAENNGEDLTRPQTSFETRLYDQSSSNASSKTDRAALIVRLNAAVNLDADWRLATLAQIPLAERTTTNFDPVATDRAFGLGDAAFQTILAHTISERWAVGVGVRLVAPTASDSLGSGKWQILPGCGVRYMLPELGDDSYFVPALRYATSFAGDPEARQISQLQIAPTLNIDLPGRLFLTFYPSYDIRINFGPPRSGQTGPLFLPFDALIGAKLTDKVQVSLEIAVPIIKDYPVYNFRAEARMRVLF